MAVLLLMIITGFVLIRVRLLDQSAMGFLTKVVLNVSLPAQILAAFLTQGDAITDMELLRVFLLSALIYVLYGLVAVAFVYLFRVPRRQRGIYADMIVFGNVGFMGFPVVTAIFGAEYLIYAVMFNAVFNLLVYSLGIMLISSGGEQRAKFNWKLLINTPMISTVLAVLLFLLRLEVPAILTDFLDRMGALTTPLAMMVIGGTIAAVPLKQIFGEKRIYAAAAVRLFLLPAIVYGVVVVLMGVKAPLGSILVVLSATPVASNVTMLSIAYGGDQMLASRGVLITTLLSVVTIPIVALLAG